VDGIAVLAFMEQRPELAGLPVLIYSALNDSADVKAILAHKPFGYLLKPYVEERVAPKIEQALQAAATRKQTLTAGHPA
jgi:CheY-like chemotaxis protein